jgi:hypothetical protein
LKIRSKPGVLQITATNRMRGAWEFQLSFAGELMETYAFPRHDPGFIQANYEAVQNLISQLGAPAPLGRQPYAWRGVAAEAVQEFLSGYLTAQRNIAPDKLNDYISKQQQDGRLTSWTIVLMQAENDANPEVPFVINGATENVRTTFRNAAGANDKSKTVSTVEYVIPKAHIISPRHEALDLTAEQLDKALTATRAERKGAAYPSGEQIRLNRPASEALLLLYPLDPEPAGYEAGIPVMGYAISFPAIKKDRKVTYMGNAQLLAEFTNDDEDALDDEADQQVTRDDD